MIYSCDNLLINTSQILLGSMFDFAEYALGVHIADCFEKFCKSPYSSKFESDDSTTIMGKSGIELAYEITDREFIDDSSMDKYTDHAISGRSSEYWVGWVLAYYQKKKRMSFTEISDIRGIEDIYGMYKTYHEMDIEKFCERMDELYIEKNPNSRLKSMRQKLGYSQSEVAKLSGIPLKTIQQYEQRQKNINHARVDYLISLSKVLSCDIEMLIEKI